MTKYTEIKAEHQKKYNALFDDCGVFWAFSNEQFKKGAEKHPLTEGDKYVSIGAGGFLAKSNVDKLTNGLKSIKAWRKRAMKDAKAEEIILYELKNHECFYSGDIDDALETLKEDGYTAEQVRTVYRKYANKLA